jgi:hypothetical protein
MRRPCWGTWLAARRANTATTGSVRCPTAPRTAQPVSDVPQLVATPALTDTPPNTGTETTSGCTVFTRQPSRSDAESVPEPKSRTARPALSTPLCRMITCPGRADPSEPRKSGELAPGPRKQSWYARSVARFHHTSERAGDGLGIESDDEGLTDGCHRRRGRRRHGGSRACTSAPRAGWPAPLSARLRAPRPALSVSSPLGRTSVTIVARIRPVRHAATSARATSSGTPPSEDA